MQKFHSFYIHQPEFHLDDKTVVFHYSFDESQYFSETITLSEVFEFRKDLDRGTAQNILAHISIAFGISYYKSFPTQEIMVDFLYLDDAQKKYWKNFYRQGLGEFFYTNNIDFSNLCQFVSTSKKEINVSPISLGEKTLLPIGGGKDSIVSALLLPEKNATPFIFGKVDTIKQSFLDIYQNNALITNRQLDPKLFEMNASGYYNGHVPITGLISFFMTFVCYVYNYKHIVFSNEKSADVGNTSFHGQEINHQYSKSNTFRDDFSQYISTYISPEISYTSLLSDYYEIQIAQIFARDGKKYFDTFSSCNKNFKIHKNTDSLSSQNFQNSDRWCGNCSKCLFVYIILRPFISLEETLEIFGEELYSRPDLENLFLETIGVSGIKPFECVGEVDEAKLAAYMSLGKFETLPYLLQVFQKHFLDTPETYFQELQQTYNI